MVGAVLAVDARHVVGDDDRHDVAQRCAHGIALRPGTTPQLAAGGDCRRPCSHHDIRGRLPGLLAPVQRACHRPAVGATATGPGARHADVEQQPPALGLFLLLAGIYQFSPLKVACLKHCRNPADFLSRHWRSGQLGALCLGWLHGIYCVGCCWVLMLLLFVGGVMNLLWIAVLAVVVLLRN